MENHMQADETMINQMDDSKLLRQLKPSRIQNVELHQIKKNICGVLNCAMTDIHSCYLMDKGLTNLSFYVEVKNIAYIYRHPGPGTEDMISRKHEAKALNIASKLNLDDTFIYMDEEAGWKLSRYMKACRDFDYHDFRDVEEAMKLLRKLHHSDVQFDWEFDIWEQTQKILHRLHPEYLHLDTLTHMIPFMKCLYERTAYDEMPKCPCHIDCYDANILTDGTRYYLIDWEYAGFGDPMIDLGTFICSSDYTKDEVYQVFTAYFKRKPTNQEYNHGIAYIALAGFYWYVWSLYKKQCGDDTGKYGDIYQYYAQTYAKEALLLYMK